MKVKDIKNLRINQEVILSFNDEKVIVKSINDWKKIIGTVDKRGQYKEYQSKLIKLIK